jgi:hypothetical protein
MGKKKTPLIYFNSNQIQIKFLKSHILQSHKFKDVTTKSSWLLATR